MHSDRLTDTLKRLAILAVFLLASGFISPLSAIQPSRAAPAAPQATLAPDYAWHTFQGGSWDDYGNGLAVDAQGNLYIVGESGGAWLGPGNTPPIHMHTGSYDIVVIKLDANGNYLWHTFFGGSLGDDGLSIALDSDGDIFIAGLSRSSWQGAGAAEPLHAYTGDYDITVLKLSNDGGYLWHTFYGSLLRDAGMEIAVDTQGAVSIGGYSYGDWEDQSISPIHPHSSVNDIAVLKLSGDGAYLWHTFYGSAQSEPLLRDSAQSLVLDDQDNLFITGNSDGSWDGDGDTAPIHSHSGDDDIFVLRLNPSGVYQWHTFYGSGLMEYGDAIVIDRQNNLIVAGESFGSWNGDSGVAPLHAHSIDYDFTVLKLSTDGVYLWHTFYGSTVDEYVYDVEVTSEGDILVAGESYRAWLGDEDADPLHPYAGVNDITLLQVGADGSYAWHTFYGNEGDDMYIVGDDYASDIAVDGVGNLILVGGSDTSWLGDGGAAPLHPINEEGDDFTVLKFAAGEYYLPLLQR